MVILWEAAIAAKPYLPDRRQHQLAVFVGAGLHGLFALGEMLPWKRPLLLGMILREKAVALTDEQLALTASIVRNAGIYNAIIAAGFAWAARPGQLGMPSDGDAVNTVRCFFFAGATVAGLFGLTLSRATIIQFVVGFAGLFLILKPF